MQNIEKKVFENFEKLLNEKQSITGESRITNSGSPANEWTRKVVEKIKISDIARQNNISKCPACHKYRVNFDDGRGWFACQDSKCRFKGNIVDFIDKTGAEI